MNKDAGGKDTWQPVAGRASIVITAYNYGKYVGDAVNSCLRQTYPDIEIVVVDDGSTDNTRSVCESFGDRIVYIHQENRGVSAARNTGLKHISGEFVTFLDADDMLTPGSISARAGIFMKDPALTMVRGAAVSLENYDPSQPPAGMGKLYVTDRFHEDLIFGRFPSSGLLRSETARRFQFPENLTNGEDLAYYIKVSFGNRVCVTDDLVLLIRRHDGSLSHNLEKMRKQGAQIISTIMDDPYYGGKLEYLRKEFTSRRYLSLSRSMFLAGDDPSAVQYYLEAVKARPASILKVSRFMKFLKAWLRMAFFRNS